MRKHQFASRYGKCSTRPGAAKPSQSHQRSLPQLFPRGPKGPKGKCWLLLVVLFGFKPLSLRCLTAYSHRFHGARWASVKRADDDTMVHVLLTVVLSVSPEHVPVCLGLSKGAETKQSAVVTSDQSGASLCSVNSAFISAAGIRPSTYADHITPLTQ